MVPGIYPTVDYAFKKVFGSESDVPVLLNLLDAVLKPLPDRRIVGLEIRNPFNSKDSADDKLSILDIKARDREGRQYNVEMQMLGLGVYPQRVLYYWAALHSQQLHEGDSYGKLRPTISISFVNSVLFPDVRDHHLNFQLRSLDHPNLVFSEHQSIHVIELPKFRRSAEELVDPLDAWCYFLKHGAELDTDNLPRALDTPAVRRAMEVLTMMTQNELERERYQSRVKAERDRISFLEEHAKALEEHAKALEEHAKALEEHAKALAERDEALKRVQQGIQQGIQQGMQQGMQQGRREGVEEGRELGRIHTLQAMLKVPLTPDAELLAMPLAELQARADALAQQFEAGR